MTDAVPTPAQRLEDLEQLLYRIGQGFARLAEAGPEPEPAVAAATRNLPGEATGSGAEFTLRQFLDSVDDLTPSERGQLIDAALKIIKEVYVHLPLKRAMHAVDPIQRLKLLQDRAERMSPGGFHQAMIGIFHSLRDLHTSYILPASYQRRTAFLPFLVEEYFEQGGGDQPHFIVTKVRPGVLPPDFQPGITLTHWNGIPIQRAVEINAEREAGSNEDAQHARGLESLTLRPMGLTAPPDEEWVTIGYEAGGQGREARVAWRVIEPPPSPAGVTLAAVGAGMDPVMGIDVRTEAARRAKKALFSPEAMETEQKMAARFGPVPAPQAGLARADGPGVESPGAPGPPGRDRGPEEVSMVLGLDALTEAARRAKKALFSPEAMEAERVMAARAVVGQAAGSEEDIDCRMPDVLTAKRVPGPQGEVGYIRIYTFMVRDADAFVAEFVRLAQRLPQAGLIVDVRGNGGGNILAGERLLQVLTPRPIEPARFHFRNTPTTLDICRRAPARFGLGPWAPAISLAIQTGETYSQGFSLESVDRYNRIGQQYQGPVVLVIDALCYSTTDMFAAGFQDHGIGPILGAHRHTGAGGANVWEYSALEQILPDRFPVLPKGASFRVAARRSTRVGERAGVPLEDLGVEPGDYHRMTRTDILDGNSDLIAKAAQLLAGQKVRALSGRIDRSQPQTVRVEAQARNISRVDAYQDGRPLASGDVRDGAATLIFPAGQMGSAPLELRGYDEGRLVAVTKVGP